jgi:hypothetical protein
MFFFIRDDASKKQASMHFFLLPGQELSFWIPNEASDTGHELCCLPRVLSLFVTAQRAESNGDSSDRLLTDHLTATSQRTVLIIRPDHLRHASQLYIGS